MRVVHIITRFIVGGAQENTLWNIIDLRDRHGDEVVLLHGPTTGPEGSLLGEVDRRGLRREEIPSLIRSISPRRDIAAARLLRKRIEQLKPDVVHTHSSKAGILGRWAAWESKVPAVIHTIHGLPFHPYESRFKNAVYRLAERWAARRCHRLITVADAMRDQALAVNVGRPEQYVTIPSGMEVEPFLVPRRSRDDVRREFGIASDRLVVGKIARLFEFKGHDDVIAAANPLLRRHPSLQFVFVGGGQWRQRLEEKVRSLGWADRFVFTGLVPPERIPELLHAVDIVVQASYREGLARVLPQALLAGKAVVSYDVDGAREVCLPEKTGLLVAPGDIAGLSTALERLIDSPSLRERMGAEGRERCRERFRHETMTRDIRAVYDDVLGRRSTPSTPSAPSG